MYAIRRTIAAFALGALIFGAPLAYAAPPVPNLAAVLAAGNDPDGQPISAGAAYLVLLPDGNVQLVGGNGFGQILIETTGAVNVTYSDKLLIVNEHGIAMHGLPTSDPGILNQLWNDNGTVKVSAG